MSGQARELWIPDQYQHLVNGEDHALLEKLQAMSLRTFMDDIDAHSTVTHQEFDDDGFITFHDMRGQQEANPAHALVELRPFGNGDSPAMLIRDRVYQALLGDQYRVLAVPNNTLFHHTYDVPHGHDAPVVVARKIIHGLVRQGIESVILSGESQGAMLGGYIMALAKDDLEIVSVSLKDAPDTVERTVKQLQKDFQGKGVENLQALNQVIRMTGLPALVRAQSAGSGLSVIRQAFGLLTFQAGAMSRENKHMQEAMTRRTFVQNLAASALLPALGDHAQVIRYGNSAICTPEIEADMIEHGIADRLATVRHLGHEGTDHVVLNALFNRAAVEGIALAA